MKYAIEAPISFHALNEIATEFTCSAEVKSLSSGFIELHLIDLDQTPWEAAERRQIEAVMQRLGVTFFPMRGGLPVLPKECKPVFSEGGQ